MKPIGPLMREHRLIERMVASGSLLEEIRVEGIRGSCIAAPEFAQLEREEDGL